MEVYVIRHTPVKTDKDICYGQLNVALADTFLQDADFYKQKLPIDFDAVYTSTLYRCTALAKELGFHDAKPEKDLMEVNFGDWEGKKWSEINQEDLNIWMNDFVHQKPTHGESLVELYQRVSNFLDNLRTQPHKKVLIITHAGFIRCIWAYLLEIPLHNIFKIPVEFNDIFIFKMGAEKLHDKIKAWI